MLKHLILLPFIFILFVFNINAQTQRHNFLIGGNGAFSKRYFESINPVTNFDQKRSLSSLNLGPSFAYFIVDNLALGASMNFRREKTFIPDEKVKVAEGNFISIGPIFRYYVPLDKWSVFSEVQVLKVYGEQNNYYLPNASKYQHDGSRIELGIGAAYFITSSVGLEGLLSFGSEKVNYESSPIQSYPNFTDFLSKRNWLRIDLGLHFYLNKNAIRKASDI